MESFWQDLRYGIRMLAKAPGFAAVAVLTLALGIGANTAIFSVVNAVLLRPLPYKSAGQLVHVWGKLEKLGIPINSISEPEWWELKDTSQSFTELAAFVPDDGANLTSADSRPVRVTEGDATSSLFSILGVQPQLGRIFTAEEDEPGKSHVVLLSDSLWRSALGADPNVVGKIIQVDGTGYTVVGVLPPGFQFEGPHDIWNPLGLDRTKAQGRGSHYLSVIGRLKPGVPLEQASSEMDRFAAQLAREHPDYVPYGPDGGWGVFLVALQEQIVGRVRPALLVLLGAVGFVLLIACVNIANLLLARASTREREIAIRAALGAGKWRIVSQLLTESVLLALVGGGFGLLLSYWGVSALRALNPDNLPRASEIGLDGTVLGFTLGLSLLTGLVFGLVPALHVAGANLQDCLKEGGRGTSGGLGGRRLRDALVVSEIALALVLLVGAGLMVRSFRRLLEVNPGFQTRNVLTMQLSLPSTTYKDGTPVISFYRQLLEKVKNLPGVEAAGAVSKLPLDDSNYSGSVFLQDTPVTGLQRFMNYPFLEVDLRMATPGYFGVMRIPLVRGRPFTEADNENAPLIAIVDTDFAQRLWPGQDPIGKQVAIDPIPNVNPPQPRWRTVVGVVAHVKNRTLDFEGREQAYFPQPQVSFSVRTMTLAVRTGLDASRLAGTVRQQVAALDRDLPIYQVTTMQQRLDTSVAQPRLNLVLLAAFATLALVLAGVGIYGVMAYSVTQRTHEIGIRMALGAQHEDVMRLVITQGLKLAALGVGIGLVAALGVTRFMSSLLFGVQATDPVTFALVALALTGIALAACFVPARRAMRVNPIVALRYE
jgi:predicted permease